MSSSVHLVIFQPRSVYQFRDRFSERRYLGPDRELFEAAYVFAEVSTMKYDARVYAHPDCACMSFINYINQIYESLPSEFVRRKLILVNSQEHQQELIKNLKGKKKGELLFVKDSEISRMTFDHFSDGLHHRERQRANYADVEKRSIAYAVPLMSFVKRMKIVLSKPGMYWLSEQFPSVIAYLEKLPNRGHSFCAILVGSSLENYGGFGKIEINQV